jgi:hypothetical protein
MTLLAMFVCLAVLFTVGYFLFAVLGEVALWLYNRITSSRVENRTSVLNQNAFDL